MRRLTLFFFLLMALDCIGQGVSPTRDVEATDDGIIVTYRFNGGFHQDDPLHPGAKFWKIPGFALNDVAGEPSYPIHNDTFLIPDDATVKLELLESEFTDTTFILAPAIPPFPISIEKEYIPIPNIINYPGFLPNKIVNMGNIQSYRGQKMVSVLISPIQYCMEQNVVRSYNYVRYKLKFIGGNAKTRKFPNEDLISSRISLSDHFLENIALNYSGKQNIQTHRSGQTPELAEKDNRSYLIITTDSLREAADRFAEWKRTKGMNVQIETRERWRFADSVKNVIMQHYLQDSTMYVLIIGGFKEVRAKVKDFSYEYDGKVKNYSHATDFYYAILDDDQMIDVYVGRLIASSLNEANTVIDKIIKYEKTPPLCSGFYENALHCTNFEDKLKFGTTPTGGLGWTLGIDSIEDCMFTVSSELIKGYVDSKGKNVNRVYYCKPWIYPLRWTTRFEIESPIDYPIRYFSGDTIPLFLQKDSTVLNRVNWEGNANDILDSINTGAFYVLYTAHGSKDGWEYPAFTSNEIASLQNGDKLPVVFSMTCLTGRYNAGSNSNCFAKQFLVKENGGCVGIFAASRESFSVSDDRLMIGMFNAIWPTNSMTNMKPTYELAQILNNGMMCVGPSLSNRMVRYTREVYHCFGDPSMMIYTEEPVTFSTPEINIQNDTITVQTTEDSVRISFYNRITKHVDSYIGNYIEYPIGNEELTVCLDKHNYIPYIIHCGKNIFIQNEDINDSREYRGDTISVGESVTSAKPTGEVMINGANVKLKGKTVILDAGTTVVNSNLQINGTP